MKKTVYLCICMLSLLFLASCSYNAPDYTQVDWATICLYQRPQDQLITLNKTEAQDLYKSMGPMKSAGDRIKLIFEYQIAFNDASGKAIAIFSAVNPAEIGMDRENASETWHIYQVFIDKKPYEVSRDFYLKLYELLKENGKLEVP